LRNSPCPGWLARMPSWLAGSDRVPAGWLPIAVLAGWLAGSLTLWLAGPAPVPPAVSPLVGFVPSLSLIPNCHFLVGPAGIEPATKGL
jgi:hypothetical protein